MRSLNNELTISAKSNNAISLKELWLYRELFYFFSWRDIKVRYKQSVLGISWAVLQPLLLAIIFSLFFHRIAGIGTGSTKIPYPVFAYLGLMFWNGFANALNTMSASLITNQGVITKIYFPRILLPLSAAALSIVDFFFAFIVLFLVMAVFSVDPHGLGLALVIPSLILITVTAMGVGTFFAALNVKYRDVKSALPYITQLWFFVTPVIYPVTLIPVRFRELAYINPAAGAINSVKSAIFGQPVDWHGLLISWVSALVMLTIGLWYFKRTERVFADVA